MNDIYISPILIFFIFYGPCTFCFRLDVDKLNLFPCSGYRFPSLYAIHVFLENGA